MKKKTGIIIAAVVALVLAVTLLLVLIIDQKKHQGEETLFEDTDYPVAYRQEKENLAVTLNGKKTKTLSWSVETEDGDIVDVSQKGKEKNGIASYLLSPKMTGMTKVCFKRSMEMEGESFDMAEICLPVYVEETADGLFVRLLENSTQLLSVALVLGEETDHPVILKNNEDGTADFVFPHGEGDWIITDEADVADTTGLVGQNGMSIRRVMEKPFYSVATGQAVASGGSGKAAGSKETILTISSKSLGIQEYIKTVIEKDGSIVVSQGEKP